MRQVVEVIKLLTQVQLVLVNRTVGRYREVICHVASIGKEGRLVELESWVLTDQDVKWKVKWRTGVGPQTQEELQVGSVGGVHVDFLALRVEPNSLVGVKLVLVYPGVEIVQLGRLVVQQTVSTVDLDRWQVHVRPDGLDTANARELQVLYLDVLALSGHQGEPFVATDF